MDLIVFLGYLRLFLILCLVLLFSPFLFHIFLFLLDSCIHLSYSDASGRFVSRTFLLSLPLIFSLVLSPLHRIFSTLFSLLFFHLSCLYSSKAHSLPCLVLFLQPFFIHVSLFLSLSVLSLLSFVLCISPRLNCFPFLCFRFCVFYLILSFALFLFLLVLSSICIFLFFFFFLYFKLHFQVFFCWFFHNFIYCNYIYIFFFYHSFRQFPFIVVLSTLL